MRKSQVLGKEIAKAALTLGAIKFSFDAPFQWASGFFMPIYNDNRVLLSKASIRKIVVDALEHLLKENQVGVDCIAGIPTAGLPWGASLADQLQLPFIYIREKAKEHGLKKQIEGVLEVGQRVVLVEDVISTGGSAAAGVPVVRDAGGTCSVCLGIYSYGFPESTRKFQEVDAQVLSALTYETLIETAKEEKLISESQLQSLMEWQQAPFAWGEKHGFQPVKKP